MADIDLSELERTIAALSGEDRAHLQRLAKSELDQPFIPNPGPQAAALDSEADWLLYGGQAGGGKTALLVGCAARGHHSALILRRQAVELDGIWAFATEVCGARGWVPNKQDKIYTAPSGGAAIRFAGLNEPDDWRKYAGNARDYYGFDEAGEFLEEQVLSLTGWLRSSRPGQRCRVILASNPPRGGDGEWLLGWFAPWLDPLFQNPAMPGELRWSVRVDGELHWVDGPGLYEHDGERYEAESYTFIPASLDDNPYLKDTPYRRRLQNLPEPLRSQLLYGDFTAGREDHEWQVIPTAWVDAAMDRWRHAEPKRRRMLALSADIAIGGADNLVIGSLHVDNWFAPLEAIRGIDVKNSVVVANHMLRLRRDNADTSVDLTGGWGEGTKTQLEQHQDVSCHGIVYSAKTGARTYDGRFGFANIRAEMYWRMREALDPEGPAHEDLMLPPDPRLKAELTAPRWTLRGTDILIEAKDDIKKRVGSSPDRSDTIVQLWHRKDYGVQRAVTGSQMGGWKETAPDEGVLSF